jgi:hypothetical protein
MILNGSRGLTAQHGIVRFAGPYTWKPDIRLLLDTGLFVVLGHRRDPGSILRSIVVPHEEDALTRDRDRSTKLVADGAQGCFSLYPLVGA